MTARESIRLELIPSTMKPQLQALMNEHLLELAALEGVELPSDDAGNVHYRYFDAYWIEPERVPLGIWVGDDLAGFCLLRDLEPRWGIAEFYIKPAYRRSGIGTAAVSLVKAYCREDGLHHTLQAAFHTWNPPAVAFWTRQGFIQERQEGVEIHGAFPLTSEAGKDHP